ncbi:MAG: thioesterase [Elusimicrobia bacterium]|nr:thioesterase [Elusimicrobiota bacterium]
MKPRLEGLVRHPLYSTWAMAYHMEVAARKLLVPYLENTEEAVGAAISIRHLEPAPIGAELNIRCTLEHVRDNRVVARLEVRSGKRKLGDGTHLQIVMSRERFRRLSRPRGGKRG